MILWNFKTGETLYRLPFRRAKYITELALAPGGEFLLSASKQRKKLELWKLPSGECVEEFHFDQRVQVITCVSNGMVCVGLQGGRVCFLVAVLMIYPRIQDNGYNEIQDIRVKN